MPLATTRTISSSGRGSQSSTVSMTNGPDLAPTTAASICMNYASRSLNDVHLLRITCCGLFGERVLQFAVLIFRRVKDHLLSGRAILIEIVAVDVLELHQQQPRLRPLAFLVEADVADDRIESVLVDVIGELAVIQTAGRLDRLFEDLHGGIGEGRLIETERIGALLRRARLV